jgi:hypothetical protein
VKKTHEEYLALAKILGQHLGCELNMDPFAREIALATHFVAHPTCPLCLEMIEKRRTGTVSK